MSSDLTPMRISRENNFDALRLFLAVAVIYTHSFDLTDVHGEILQHLTNYQLSASGFAVFGFFVISGFLITGSWLRSGDFKDFLSRRARRIVPGFVTAVIFCFLIVGPIASVSLSAYFHDPTAWGFLKLILFRGPEAVNTIFVSNPGPHGMNGSLWTIRIEALCYAFTAILGLAGLLRRRIAVLSISTAALALTWLCGLGLIHLPKSLILGQFISLLGYYCIGSSLYILKDHIFRSKVAPALCAAVFLLTLIFGGFYYTMPITAGYMLIYSALSPVKHLSHAAKYGDFSYGTYLYAFPIQQLIIYFSRPTPNPYFVMLLTVPITLALAFLSWHYVEEPCLGSARRRRMHATSSDTATTRINAVSPPFVVPTLSGSDA